MRGSLKTVLSRVNRLAERVQPSPETISDEEFVEILETGRAEARAVRPKLSLEEGRAIYARLKAMMDQ